jgi:23S rRNA (pseudouridine1915-N3)-methyltransferase
MLNIDIICVGGLKEQYWRDACNEYCKRLTPWVKLRIVEISEERSANASESMIKAVLEAEGERILAALPEQAFAIALCIEGTKLTSEKLAAKISEIMLSGRSSVEFIIGGSHGLSKPVKNRAQLCFSMSDLTFPHQLARVMLLEQIYRAMSINMGGKYHK